MSNLPGIVKQKMKFIKLIERGVNNARQQLPALSACDIPPRKMVTNHSREYWYIGSILPISDTQKKRICVITATGIYWDLV